MNSSTVVNIIALVLIPSAPLISFALALSTSARSQSITCIVTALTIDLVYGLAGSLPLATLCMLVALWGFEPLRRELA